MSEPIPHTEAYKMINEQEGEEVFKSPEELKEILMILAEKGLIEEKIERFHCQEYDREEKSCPAIRHYLPKSPNDKTYLRIMRDAPKLTFNPMLDIFCKHTDCLLYGRMIRGTARAIENR